MLDDVDLDVLVARDFDDYFDDARVDWINVVFDCVVDVVLNCVINL